MKQPIFLIDHGDISAFSSPEDLEMYVESPDIADYLVFDAAGRQLELHSITGRRGSVVDIDSVRLVAVFGMPQTDLLRNSLKSFLNRLDIPTSDHDELPELIKTFVEVVGYTK